MKQRKEEERQGGMEGGREIMGRKKRKKQKAIRGGETSQYELQTSTTSRLFQFLAEGKESSHYFSSHGLRLQSSL